MTVLEQLQACYSPFLHVFPRLRSEQINLQGYSKQTEIKPAKPMLLCFFHLSFSPSRLLFMYPCLLNKCDTGARNRVGHHAYQETQVLTDPPVMPASEGRQTETKTCIMSKTQMKG